MSILQVEAVPIAISVETSDDELTVSLTDGRRISVPLVWFPRLLNASIEDRSDFRLMGGGDGIHWPRLDEDISVAGLLRGSPPRPVDARHSRIVMDGVEYRRHDNSDTWHSSSRCSAYPTEDYFIRRTKPTSDQSCNECAGV